MNQFAGSQGIVERVLDGLVHHSQILCRDQGHETGDQNSAALDPVINARVAVLKLFGSDVRDDVFRQTKKVRSEIFAHGDIPRPFDARGYATTDYASGKRQNNEQALHIVSALNLTQFRCAELPVNLRSAA